jgi:hypothetical protein
MSQHEGLLRRLRTPPKGHAEQTDTDKLAAASAIESLEFQLSSRLGKLAPGEVEAKS